MSSSVDFLPGDALGKHIRTAGYLVLAFAAFFPLLDLAAAMYPPNFSNATWRFGAIGLMANFAMGLSLELFLLAVIAAFAGHRRVLLVLGVISVILAVVLLGSIVLFALDAVQTRAKVNPAVMNRFDFAAVTAIGKLLMYAIANALLARGEFLLARRRGRTAAGKGRAMPPLVGAPAASDGGEASRPARL